LSLVSVTMLALMGSPISSLSSLLVAPLVFERPNLIPYSLAGF